MNRILMIEDEPGLQLTVRDLLENEAYQVEVRGDGSRGEEEAASGLYDLILLDVMLPGRDGFQVCKNLRDRGIGTPILMLTARGTSIDTVMGLKLGADDYLTKPFDGQVLLARIEALLRRTAPTVGSGKNRAAPTGEFGRFTLDRERGQLFEQVGEQRREVPLNTQEYRLLLYLADNPGKILSRNELLDGVWGYETETSTRTVDVHIAWLRQKLGEKDRPRHIITLRGRGYKFSVG
ncbi:MAG: response regulator transcription factor [Spirochaetales bacterium]|nr:response regulator transcription factor [Spirochaetales bacterium]